MSFLDALDARYRLILCDVWGVVHNGVEVLPGAAERLRCWRDQGRFVILLTNAPRTAEAVAEQLVRIGLPQGSWDAIATSGEAGIEALNALGKPVGFIGTAGDRSVLESRDVRIADDEDFSDLACSGIDGQRRDPEQYRSQLRNLVDRKVHMHCLNPDRLVMRGGIPEACAGALADIYLELGGLVTWYGKPFPEIYVHAMNRAGDPPANAVLAIGDGLQTDVLGAARMGFDVVFVTGGIHAGEPFPLDFAARNDLGNWRPVAVVPGLA